MLTILLYGHLGKKFGRVHKYYVSSASEAIRAMCATLDGFQQAIIDGGSYRLLRGGRSEITEDSLADPHSEKETLRIIPVVSGSGGDGIGSIIIGVALIWATGGLASLGAGFGGISALAGTTMGTFLGSLGLAMVMGGVSQLLFSPPEVSQQSTTREVVSNMPSFAFAGAVNTTAQGNAVPVCYGQMLVGSQVISAGLSVEQV